MTTLFAMPTTMSNTEPTSCVSTSGSFGEWSRWAEQSRANSNSSSQTRQSDLLLDEDVDEKEQIHMVLPPTKLAANDQDEDIVARVVAFCQAIHQRKHILGNHHQPEFQTDFDTTNDKTASLSLAASTSTSAFAPPTPLHQRIEHENVSIAELRRSHSFMKQQEDLWGRLKKQQPQQQQDMPQIPEWLHQAAQMERRRIRVVPLDSKAAKRRVVCVGCANTLLADRNVEIVYCPACGCTFSPDICCSTTPLVR